MCLKCKQYLFFTIQSNKRNPVIFEHLPQALLDNIAGDTDERTQDLVLAMQKMPSQMSILLVSHYILDLNQAEIGRILHKSQRTVSRNLREAVEVLKKIVKKAPL